MEEFQLAVVIGFTCHTTFAAVRVIFSGFFDRCTKLKIIAAHAGVR